MCKLVFTLLLASSLISGQWIRSSVLLPNDDRLMAAGYYQGVVTLVGGRTNSRDVMQYIVEFDAVSKDDNALIHDIYAFSQYWYQLGSVLYMFDQSGQYLNLYDLSSKTLTTWRDIAIPVDVGQYGCIVATEKAIYIMGGSASDRNDNLQIFDLSGSEWSQGPTLNLKRTRFSCVHSPTSNALYAIAGKIATGTPGERTDSIEYISVESITDGSGGWQYTSDPLLYELQGAMAALYRSDIFVLGGSFWDNSSWVYMDIVHVIQTGNSNKVIVMEEDLDFGVSYTSPIVVDSVLYAFGGRQDDGYIYNTAKIQYYSLNYTTTSATPAPTMATTATATATEYRVTIEFRSASCADILVTVADALDASLAQVTVAEETCEDDDDVGEGSDATTTATLLVTIADDVQLDTDVIQSALREAMVEEYGEDIVDVGVKEEEEDDREEDTRSHAGVTTMNMVAGGLIGAFLCGICVGAFCWYDRRRRHVQQLAVIAQQQQQPEAQPQQPHQPQPQQPEPQPQPEVGIEMVPGAVADIEPGAYHANADVDDEKENEDDESAGDENEGNAAVTPGIHQVATFVAGAGENSDSEQLYNDSSNNNNDKGTSNPTPTNATPAGTSGATVGHDPKLGVYELKHSVDL